MGEGVPPFKWSDAFSINLFSYNLEMHLHSSRTAASCFSFDLCIWWGETLRDSYDEYISHVFWSAMFSKCNRTWKRNECNWIISSFCTDYPILYGKSRGWHKTISVLRNQGCFLCRLPQTFTKNHMRLFLKKFPRIVYKSALKGWQKSQEIEWDAPFLGSSPVSIVLMIDYRILRY